MSALSLILITPAVRFRLLSFIRKMVYDPGAADSILADSISRAMERVESDKPRNFIAWLYSIARNMARHWIRDRKVYERMLEGRGERSTRSAFAEVMSQEALEVFDGELSRLSRNQRRALLMRIVDRMSCEEIAEKMELASGAVRALLHRARQRLRGWLGYMRAL